MPDFGEIGDHLDALDIDLSVLIYAVTTGDIDELEEALKRVDRGALYLQVATEAMERLLLIIYDQEIRKYLLTIPQLYLDALPADEAVKYSLSLATQKGIDVAIVVGGTAAGTAAGGVGGPAMAVLLTGATTAKSAGKAAEPLLKALNNVVVGKKHSKNNHKEKPEDDETELDKTCPICRDSKCKNRKRLKKGKGYTDRKGARHTKNMKKAKPGYPKTHAWYAGPRTLAAHHVIPIEAVKDDPYFEKAFDNFNFDINTIDNLVTLPMTPELACELGVQCHYTNHDQGIALNEDLSAFDRLLTHEQNNNADKLNAFGGKLLSKKPFLAYPKAAEKLALEVLYLVKKGNSVTQVILEKSLLMR